MVARDALAVKKLTFFPKFATLAKTKNDPGYSGAMHSNNVAPSKASALVIRHNLGFTSNSRTDDIFDAKSTPPNCPIPSLRIQLIAPAMTEVDAAVVDEPIPKAINKLCVERTMAVDDAVDPKKEYRVYNL